MLMLFKSTPSSPLAEAHLAACEHLTLNSKQFTKGQGGYSVYAEFFSYPYSSLFVLCSLSFQMILLFF